MRAWKMPWRVLREPEREELAAPEIQLLKRPVSAPDNDALDAMDSVCRDLRESLDVEIDEGTAASVPFTDRDPARTLEVTQRARELRERERSSVRPVYNFGGESSWSGGEW
jgi:hypothetical protein